jgi:signal recognition particle receptor subunit alpha
LENEFSVLIAACDTFCAGAVEQLKTHVHHLCAVHPSNEIHKKKYGRDVVQLYEKGYGKSSSELNFILFFIFGFI